MQQKCNKLLSFLLMLSAAAGLLTGFAEDAHAASISYQEASYSESAGVTYTTKTADNATAVASSTSEVTWSDGGWYYVSGTLTISGRITVSGTANLILCDGAMLSADSGITVADGHTLNIYAQTGGTGKLYAVGSSNTAAIGSGGTLTIHGGHVDATGGSNTAAIACTSVDVYSGHVAADGGSNASGITGTITVSSILRVFGGSSTSAINVLTDYSSNRPQYMRVTAPHISHSLSDYHLSADGTTITAVCANSDGLCGFPDATATRTISAPETAGGAAILSGDAEAFGVSSSNIMYAKKSGSDWVDESSTVPTGSGFFKASITVNEKTAYVTYGVSAITVASGITHGTVTAPEVAAVGVVVSLTISPETGYELDTLTPTKTGDGTAIDVTTNADGSKSFVMPDEAVTVNATFKMTDYTISFAVTSASIIVPETANYQDTVRLIISPDAGYGVSSITITDGVTLNLVSKDTDTGVEIYEFSMPA